MGYEGVFLLNILNRIYEKIQRHIDLLSEWMDMDIYVVDSDLLRVNGTGIYKRMLGIVLPKQTSNGWVTQNRQRLIILYPGEEVVCENCPMNLSDNCGGELSVHEPIFLDDIFIGVVTIASHYDEASKERMKENLDRIIHSAEELGKDIGEMAMDALLKSCFKQSMERSDYPILITNQSGKVLNVLGAGAGGYYRGDTIWDIVPKNEDLLTPQNEGKEIEINANLSLYWKEVGISGDQRYYSFFFKSAETHPGMNREIQAGPDKQWGRLIGNSEKIRKIKNVIHQVAKYDSNCLILGESGTGKEMFAKLIHDLSNREKENFVSINCAAIPESLLESELFGYEAGSFTGANKTGKKGLFESANKGTVFLDEIGDLPLHLQPKLLRAIETKRFKRVGGVQDVYVDIRFIAATNHNLTEKIKEKQFRSDLYYRLCVLLVEVPPLRERSDDIISLSNFFLSRYSRKFEKNVERLSQEVIRLFFLYRWPGNVRELENVIEYGVSMEKSSVLTYASLPPAFLMSVNDLDEKNKLSVQEFKERTLESLLLQYGNDMGAKEKIAAEMGISLSTLYRYLKRMKKTSHFEK